jgi:16S rRNA processing protein RimM
VKERLVALGYVSRAHGVLGEVRIERFNEASEVLAGVREIVVRPRGDVGGGRTIAVESARPNGKAMLARLRGVETREAAEALRGHEVCVPRSVLPEAGEGEVYLVDLVDLEVREGERVVGRVTGVVHHPAADCVVVTTELPVAEPYLVEVDLRDRILRVAHVEDFEPEKAT